MGTLSLTDGAGPGGTAVEHPEPRSRVAGSESPIRSSIGPRIPRRREVGKPCRCPRARQQW
jgi:hypothetical protein